MHAVCLAVHAGVSDSCVGSGVLGDGIVEQGNQLWTTWDLGCLFEQVSPSPLFAYGLLARSQPGRGNGTTKEISAPH